MYTKDSIDYGTIFSDKGGIINGDNEETYEENRDYWME
jgi:hypothetical protein